MSSYLDSAVKLCGQYRSHLTCKLVSSFLESYFSVLYKIYFYFILDNLSYIDKLTYTGNVLFSNSISNPCIQST